MGEGRVGWSKGAEVVPFRLLRLHSESCLRLLTLDYLVGSDLVWSNHDQCQGNHDDHDSVYAKFYHRLTKVLRIQMCFKWLNGGSRSGLSNADTLRSDMVCFLDRDICSDCQNASR